MLKNFCRTRQHEDKVIVLILVFVKFCLENQIALVANLYFILSTVYIIHPN